MSATSGDTATPSPLRTKIAAYRLAAAELERSTSDERPRDLENARRAAYDALVGQVRSLLVRGMQRLDVAPADAEDEAQRRAEKIAVTLIESDENPEGYIATCARTARTDVARRRKRESDRSSADEHLQLADLSIRIDDAYDVQRVMRVLPEIISRLPALERHALIEIDVRGRTREELAHEDLSTHPRTGDGRERTYEEARGAVYQRLSRARNRVRRELRSRFGEWSPS